MGDASQPSSARAMKLLARLLRAERRGVMVIVGHGVGLGAVSLAVPASADALVSAIAFGGLVQPIVILSLLLLAALAFGAVLRASSFWVIELMEQRVFARLALDAEARLRDASPDALEAGYADPVNRLLDAPTLQKGFAHLVSDALFLAIQLVVGAALLALYHPYLVVFGLTLVIAVTAVVWGPLARGERTSIVESSRKHELVSSFERIFEATTGHLGAASPPPPEAVEGGLAAYLAARTAHAKITLAQVGAIAALQALGLAALLGVGGVLVIGGQLTLGQLVAAEIIVSGLMSSLTKAGKQIETYYDVVAAADKVSYLLELSPATAPVASARSR